MEIINSNPDCCIVSLFVHNVCNFNCSYCSDEHRDGSYRWPTKWDGYLDLIDEIKEKKKYVYVQILGGEPTLWPKFHDFIDYISDDRTYIEYATNGSRTKRYWESLPKHTATALFSWHHEEADDDHYLDVLEIMQDKATCVATFLLTPDNYERGQALYHRIVEKKLRVEAIPKFTRVVIDGPDYFEYTDEQKKWIQSHYWNNTQSGPNFVLPLECSAGKLSEMIASENYWFQGWKCNAGLDRIYVHTNGEIWRCTKQVGGSLGNINTYFELPKDPIICDTHKPCTCRLETILTKWK